MANHVHTTAAPAAPSSSTIATMEQAAAIDFLPFSPRIRDVIGPRAEFLQEADGQWIVMRLGAIYLQKTPAELTSMFDDLPSQMVQTMHGVKEVVDRLKQLLEVMECVQSRLLVAGSRHEMAS